MNNSGNGSRNDLVDSLQQVLIQIGKVLAVGGGLVCLGAIVLLVYTCFVFAGNAPQNAANVAGMIATYQKALNVGLLALMIGTTYLYWGEETLGVLQILFAGALYFAPVYMPGVLGLDGKMPEQIVTCLAILQYGGMMFGTMASGVLVADITNRVRLRIQQGIRLDQLKYGKGVREERSHKSVFLGKCWQLPFCRKFVREACPIYHSRRTCWKEKTGCMCEEEVIRNAMQGKVIPKDAMMAAKYIPRNDKLTGHQKKERCKQCVIYNEHQKHKYRASLGVVLLGFTMIYLIGRKSLIAATSGMMINLDKAMSTVTFSQQGSFNKAIASSPIPLQELLLVCLLVVLLAYTLKLVEYLIFKLKV